MNRSTNKYRHRWIDEGLQRNGVRSYSYHCRNCGAEKIKSSAYHDFFRVLGSAVWVYRSPECVEVTFPKEVK